MRPRAIRGRRERAKRPSTLRVANTATRGSSRKVPKSSTDSSSACGPPYRVCATRRLRAVTASRFAREGAAGRWNPVLVNVRGARSEDAEAMARVMAVVAEEGLIATEPPVDIGARAQRFRETIEGEGPDALWVL